MMLQGLGLSVMGMGLTFAALGLIIVVMVVLQRLFSPQPTSYEPEMGETLLFSPPAHGPEDEIVAAIAAGLAHFGALSIGGAALGSALEAQRGRWWVMGQAQQHRVGGPVTQSTRQR
ncbi:MAG: OadG family protein [Anaerolineae bacterium]